MRELELSKDAQRARFFVNKCAVSGCTLNAVIKDLHDEHLIGVGASKIVCYNLYKYV